MRPMIPKYHDIITMIANEVRIGEDVLAFLNPTLLY